MIYSLDIKDPTGTPIEWLPKVAALAVPRTFEFKPGLNILWGRNGSGKTTVIRLLAMLLHCAQGGEPVVTESSIVALRGSGRFSGDNKDVKDVRKAIALTHDGQGVRFFDPGQAVGLSHGQFDDDFYTAGVMNTMFKGSAGQTTIFRMEEILQAIVRGKVPDVKWKFNKSHVNDTWRGYAELTEHFLAGNAPNGQPTILLDEPERSLDVNAMVGCWRHLRAYSGTTQFIVASHCLFALNIPEANYIDMSPKYLDGCKRAIGLLGGWAAEKPQRIPESELPSEPRDKKSPPARKSPARKESR